MSIWDEEEFEVRNRRGNNGKGLRTEFGIARRTTGTKQAFLYVPKRVGAQPGQSVKFVRLKDGLAFRFGDGGAFKTIKPNEASRSLLVTLPEDLIPYAGPKVRDITVTPYQGGWFIPFEQFK